MEGSPSDWQWSGIVAEPFVFGMQQLVGTVSLVGSCWQLCSSHVRQVSLPDELMIEDIQDMLEGVGGGGVVGSVEMIAMAGIELRS